MLLAKSFQINDTAQYEDNRHKAKQGVRDYLEDQQSKRRKCPHSKGDCIFDPQGKGGVFGADLLRLIWRDTGCVYALDLLLAARGCALGQWPAAWWLGAKAPDRVEASLRRAIRHGGGKGYRRMAEAAEPRI